MLIRGLLPHLLCASRRKLQQLPPGHVPLKVRLHKAGEAVAHGAKLTVGFLVATPSK